MNRALACLSMFGLLASSTADAETLLKVDLRSAQAAKQWRPTHDVSRIEALADGMTIVISGPDPYVQGPAIDLPTNTPLWLNIRLRSDLPGTFQVFYSQQGKDTSEANSVRFDVAAKAWQELKIPFPSLGPRTVLRLDPPGTRGTCTVSDLRFDARIIFPEPKLAAPIRLEPAGNLLTVMSGAVQLRHETARFGAWELRIGGVRMAVGLPNARIAYQSEKGVRWVNLTNGSARRTGTGLTSSISAVDPGGAVWRLEQRFAPNKRSSISVVAKLTATQPRKLLYAPLFIALPGATSFGHTKQQALFCGLEYLDSNASETSSSEADLRGPQARRQTPDTAQITIPLMAVAAKGRFVSLEWKRSDSVAALFDVPDRIFRAGGHLMGLIGPGSNGQNRVEGNLLPYDGVEVSPARPITVRATLAGGLADDATSAVRAYVVRHPLPQVPRDSDSAMAYIAQAAAGWMKSKIGQGSEFRHMYWPGNMSRLQPAADAAVYLKWLAEKLSHDKLAADLAAASKSAIGRMSPADMLNQHIGHITYPVVPLVFGEPLAAAKAADSTARALLGRFEPDGSIPYVKRSGALDYGSTHFARDANGLTAQVVAHLLELASLSGDSSLITAALARLRGLSKFDHTVPRGAQTWEVPLHTPDILASAHLVRAYTLGYQLTGDKSLLQSAVNWAWTGVPFVYLDSPVKGPIGLYATTPVLGATQWQAPNWMGLPVQWCGLVYADALYRLEPFDQTGPWRRLADGITASGIQQTFGHEDPDLQGLLPDSFTLRTQVRNAVAINPGTVQANAARLLFNENLYDMHVFRSNGAIVHVPGSISRCADGSSSLEFTVAPWSQSAYYVLVSGLKSEPTVSVSGTSAPNSSVAQYDAAGKRLVLRLTGKQHIRLAFGSP